MLISPSLRLASVVALATVSSCKERSSSRLNPNPHVHSYLNFDDLTDLERRYFCSQKIFVGFAGISEPMGLYVPPRPKQEQLDLKKAEKYFVDHILPSAKDLKSTIDRLTPLCQSMGSDVKGEVMMAIVTDGPGDGNSKISLHSHSLSTGKTVTETFEWRDSLVEGNGTFELLMSRQLSDVFQALYDRASRSRTIDQVIYLLKGHGVRVWDWDRTDYQFELDNVLKAGSLFGFGSSGTMIDTYGPGARSWRERLIGGEDADDFPILIPKWTSEQLCGVMYEGREDLQRCCRSKEAVRKAREAREFFPDAKIPSLDCPKTLGLMKEVGIGDLSLYTIGGGLENQFHQGSGKWATFRVGRAASESVLLEAGNGENAKVNQATSFFVLGDAASIDGLSPHQLEMRFREAQGQPLSQFYAVDSFSGLEFPRPEDSVPLVLLDSCFGPAWMDLENNSLSYVSIPFRKRRLDSDWTVLAQGVRGPGAAQASRAFTVLYSPRITAKDAIDYQQIAPQQWSALSIALWQRAQQRAPTEFGRLGNRLQAKLPSKKIFENKNANDLVESLARFDGTKPDVPDERVAREEFLDWRRFSHAVVSCDSAVSRPANLGREWGKVGYRGCFYTNAVATDLDYADAKNVAQLKANLIRFKDVPTQRNYSRLLQHLKRPIPVAEGADHRILIFEARGWDHYQHSNEFCDDRSVQDSPRAQDMLQKIGWGRVDLWERYLEATDERKKSEDLRRSVRRWMYGLYTLEDFYWLRCSYRWIGTTYGSLSILSELAERLLSDRLLGIMDHEPIRNWKSLSTRVRTHEEDVDIEYIDPPPRALTKVVHSLEAQKKMIGQVKDLLWERVLLLLDNGKAPDLDHFDDSIGMVNEILKILEAEKERVIRYREEQQGFSEAEEELTWALTTISKDTSAFRDEIERFQAIANKLRRADPSP